MNTHKWLLDCDFQDEEKLQQAEQWLIELSKDEDIIEKLAKRFMAISLLQNMVLIPENF